MPLNPFRPMRQNAPGATVPASVAPSVAPPNLNPVFGRTANPGVSPLFPTVPLPTRPV